jgi:hypothetical protein
VRAPRTAPGNGGRFEGQAAAQRELLHETNAVVNPPPRAVRPAGPRESTGSVGSRAAAVTGVARTGHRASGAHLTAPDGASTPDPGIGVRASGKTLPGGAQPRRAGRAPRCLVRTGRPRSAGVDAPTRGPIPRRGSAPRSRRHGLARALQARTGSPTVATVGGPPRRTRGGRVGGCAPTGRVSPGSPGASTARVVPGRGREAAAGSSPPPGGRRRADRLRAGHSTLAGHRTCSGPASAGTGVRSPNPGPSGRTVGGRPLGVSQGTDGLRAARAPDGRPRASAPRHRVPARSRGGPPRIGSVAGARRPLGVGAPGSRVEVSRRQGGNGLGCTGRQGFGAAGWVTGSGCRHVRLRRVRSVAGSRSLAGETRRTS